MQPVTAGFSGASPTGSSRKEGSVMYDFGGTDYAKRVRRLYQIDAKSLKGRIDLKAFYEKELAMLIPHSSGWIKAGVCPFHDTSKSGSFSVNLESGGFQCFVPECSAKGGDVIAFTMQRYSLNFQSALKRLARDWS
jgi:DNA primase